MIIIISYNDNYATACEMLCLTTLALLWG